MRIVIVGAGVIGANLAKELSEENHEVYVVENKEDVARKADERLDVKLVVGEGSDPRVLREAGIEDADLVIAVTTSDETNLVVCSLAAAYRTRKKIARVRNAALNRVVHEMGLAHFYIDEITNPEEVAAKAIVKAVQAPGSRDVADFASGKILLRSFSVREDSPLCGLRIEEFRQEDFPWPFLIIAINRNETTLIPKGDAVLQGQDKVYVLLPAASLGEFLAFFDVNIRKPKKVVIYGGTNMGETVARDLSTEIPDILLLEEDPDRAHEIAGRLDRVRVINGSPSETEILTECGIEAADAFVAASTSDHSNLISAVLAKKMGAKATVITTQQPDYMAIIEALDIDSVINPRFLAVDQILRVVRGRSVSSVATLVECNAEVLELIPDAHSPVTHAPLKDLRFPPETIVGAVLRNSEPFLADGNTHIRAGEKVIVFCRERNVGKVQKLFTHKNLI